VRREPYWHRLSKGQYVGFRRGSDTWHVRLRDRSGQQHQQALPDLPNFDEAKKAAETWLTQLGVAPVRRARRGTVREALEAYLQWLRDHGRESTAKNALPKFRKTVWDHDIASIRLHSLTRDDFREWREGLRQGRKPRSINRIVRDVQAGLNRAIKEGHVGSPAVWTIEPLVDDDEAGGKSMVLLGQAQRRALIEKADEAAAAFLRGLELTGARPSELARATVGDVIGRSDVSVRLCHWKGRPPKPRWRTVLLSVTGAEFFKNLVKGRNAEEQLFLNPRRRQWERQEWAEEIRNAAAIVNAKAKGKRRIPAGVCAYSFRHSRISEMLQIHGVDPLTVAVQHGTSMRMLEETYFEFIPKALREKLLAVSED
jgi:integrase